MVENVSGDKSDKCIEMLADLLFYRGVDIDKNKCGFAYEILQVLLSKDIKFNFFIRIEKPNGGQLEIKIPSECIDKHNYSELVNKIDFDLCRMIKQRGEGLIEAFNYVFICNNKVIVDSEIDTNIWLEELKEVLKQGIPMECNNYEKSYKESKSIYTRFREKGYKAVLVVRFD